MRARKSRLAGAIVLWSVIAASPALAQQGSAGPQARRDELAKVQEALADPDPMQRLANMEAIVRRGDPVQTELAIRTAFASDDAELRGLAMRAFIAAAGEITFDIALPADQQREREAAPANRLRTRESQHESAYVRRLELQSFKLHLTISSYDFPQANGTAEAAARRPASFVIKGSQFSSQMLTNFGRCYVEFAPTTKPALEGTLACDGGWPRLPITAAVF